MAALTDLDEAMLEFAAVRFNHRGTQDEAILELFCVTPSRYWQRVNALLDDPAALAYAPTTVNRLRRVRDEKRRARSIRSLG